ARWRRTSTIQWPMRPPVRWSSKAAPSPAATPSRCCTAIASSSRPSSAPDGCTLRSRAGERSPARLFAVRLQGTRWDSNACPEKNEGAKMAPSLSCYDLVRTGRGWLSLSPELPPRPVVFRSAAEIDAVGEVRPHHTIGVIAQLGQAHRVVALDQQEQGFFGGGCLREVADRGLRAIDRGDIRAAVVVVARNVHFVGGERIHQVLHARARIVGVAALGEALGE